jgi:hypothetical protein
MSFAAPLWLAIAGLVAAGVIVAHLISTSVPQRDPFPTARFIPEGAPLTVLRTRRLTDIVLLLLRLLAIALLGLALAGARVATGGPSRVVLADMSRAVASPAEVRDSVAAQGGDVVVIEFDAVASAAASAPARALAESREPSAERRTRGSLSAALVAAHRRIADVTKDRDKTELVIVSPILREEVDASTPELLRLWPGSVRHVIVTSAIAPTTRRSVRSSGDDPVAAALAESREPRAESRQSIAEILVVRDAPTVADSVWARDSAGALVIWPANLSTSVLSRRSVADSAQGVAMDSQVVIDVFARTHEPAAGRALARWLDGLPAATERDFGRGCIREVAIPVDRVGDIALRDNFRGMARALASPCGGERDFAAAELAPSLLARAALSPGGRASAPALTDAAPSRVALWLAVIALVTLMAEQMLRRRQRVA